MRRIFGAHRSSGPIAAISIVRCGSFDSARRLEQAIMRCLTYWNQHAEPFRWTRSAADIKRSRASVTAIYEMQH
jgi:hypothetical protein